MFLVVFQSMNINIPLLTFFIWKRKRNNKTIVLSDKCSVISEYFSLKSCSFQNGSDMGPAMLSSHSCELCLHYSTNMAKGPPDWMAAPIPLVLEPVMLGILLVPVELSLKFIFCMVPYCFSIPWLPHPSSPREGIRGDTIPILTTIPDLTWKDSVLQSCFHSDTWAQWPWDKGYYLAIMDWECGQRMWMTP